MWHPKRQVCVPVPFTCPLFQVLNYPVTFCWKSSTRNVTSVDQTYGARHLPTRNIPLELSVGFLSAWLVCPTLLLPTCNIPHWRCTQKDTSTASASDTTEPQELGRGQWEQKSCVWSLQFQGGTENPSPGNRDYCSPSGAVPLKPQTQKAWL